MNEKNNLKSTIIFISFNLLVVVIFLALFEFTLTVLYKNPTKIPDFALKAFSRYYSESGRNTIQVESACAQYNPRLFYTLKPGTCTFENIEFSTTLQINRIGLRDFNSALDSPEIVFLGDSFTMGWGVNQEEAFPQIIRSSGKKILNAGVSSYGTVRELILLKTIALDSAETIVIQYHTNDDVENTEYLRNNNQLVVSSKARYDSLCHAYEKEKRYYPGKLLGKIGRFYLKNVIDGAKEQDRDYQREAVNFLQVLKDSDQLKLKKMVIFEVGSHNKNKNLFIDALEKEIFSGSYPDHIKNAKLLRLETLFSESDYFILDDHLNSKGHQKLATTLLEYL